MSAAGPLEWCADSLAALAAAGLRRYPVTRSGGGGPEVEVDGRRVVQFCSNDYLGLAGDPRLRSAASAAAGRWGAGAGSSRLVSGSLAVHQEVEAALAAHEGCPDALVFSSGYLAAVGTIPALVGREDAVFSDALNHASLIDGCRLSGAQVVVYPHGDLAFLAAALAATPARRRLIVTDTVFSMEGDVAPLAGLLGLAERHGAMVLVDEAHATGVLGPGGAGALAVAGLTGRAVVLGTLSKALGSAGGFVAGGPDLVEWLRNRARTYAFDTAPAPAAMGAALAALGVVREEPDRRVRVLASAGRVAAELTRLGYRVLAPAAAIVPVVVGDAREAVALAGRLLAAGILVPAIRPPSVPEGTSRLRVTLSAAHTEEHLERVVAAFAGRPSARGRSLARPAGGFFVTGTGTGVGKTVVAAALARVLTGRGLRVGVLKVAQTGAGDDLAFIRAAAGVRAGDCVAPHVFADPLAPAVCARREGRPAGLPAVLAAYRALGARCDAVIVEGAGGLLVPLDDDTTMAGAAAAIGLPVVVVALPGLGTLNHSALTVEAAARRGLAVAGLVVSGLPAEPDLAERTNPAELERLTGLSLLGVIPALAGLDVDRGLVPEGFDPGPWLAPALGGTFERAGFLAGLEPVHEHT